MTTSTISVANRRREPRERVRKSGFLHFLDGQPQRPCLVFDISPSGARIKIVNWRDLPSTFAVQIENQPLRQAEIRSQRVGVLGVRFVNGDLDTNAVA